MAVVAAVCLVLGVVTGHFILPPEASAFLVKDSDWVLYFFILSVGVSVGANRDVWKKLRELLAFFLIPLLARYTNYYTAIAPAAATSEDTTLPVLMKYTDEETVVMAVFNGVLCSLLVPLLTRFIFYF